MTYMHRLKGAAEFVQVKTKACQDWICWVRVIDDDHISLLCRGIQIMVHVVVRNLFARTLTKSERVSVSGFLNSDWY